jgi:galactokinase
VALQSLIIQAFQERYGVFPNFLIRAPGRVNLIGEHTDYNDGFVLPMAIDQAIWIALRPRQDHQIACFSLDLEDEVHFSLDSFQSGGEKWGEYIKGVVWAMQEEGMKLSGWEGVLAGDVPVGAGLSSSAALEMAIARANAVVSGLEWDPIAFALLSQQAENIWVGVQCGIMDQLISAAGVEGHGLLIDCRSLEVEPIPMPPKTSVVILDTGTRRGLVESAYNERRKQCEVAAKFFKVPALRDVSVEQYQASEHGLDVITRKRAWHVITENERTLMAARAMRSGDAVALGRLMDASHVSLRDRFEVSSEALNLMVSFARRHPACFGARMTGAGFGGCAVALVQESQTEFFTTQVADDYQKRTNIEPKVYICKASRGADVIIPDGGNE